MNRPLSILFSPAAVLAVITAAVFWFCARHPSGASRDVEVLERLVMGLPHLVGPVVFATVTVPGAKNWWWLGRAVGFTFIALCVGAGRMIAGFATGANGQDAEFIMVLAFGWILESLGIVIPGAMILGETRPAFADWFRHRRFFGSFLTLLSALPIGFGLGVLLKGSLAMILGIAAAKKPRRPWTVSGKAWSARTNAGPTALATTWRS